MSDEVVADILKQGRIFEVGGAVRDRLLLDNPEPKDRDYLVTGIEYDKLTRLLKNHGRVDVVGRSFGVIKYTEFINSEPITFDISLPRSEQSTGWGHKDFAVDCDPNLSVEDDLKRRDFTINAIAVDVQNGTIIDPHYGREDIENKLLRTVYKGSFKDDPLRMLRAVQFAARFNLLIDPQTFAEIRDNAKLISSVSAERIAEELSKLLTLAKEPSIGFRLMETTGLLAEILPELQECVGVDQPGGFHAHTVFEHTMHTIDATPPILRVRLAALFHDIRKPFAKRLTETGASFYGHESHSARTAIKVMDRLRYSKDLSAEVSTLVDRHMFTTDVSDKGMRRLMRRVGIDLIYDLLDLRRADVVGQGMGGTTEDVDLFEANIKAEIDRKPPLSVSDMDLNGHDVMTIFELKPGPMVGKVLNYLLECVLDDPKKNERQSLIDLATEYMEDNSNRNRQSDEGTNE